MALVILVSFVLFAGLFDGHRFISASEQAKYEADAELFKADTDHIKLNYNIGDLLNMPSFHIGF